MPTKRNQDLLDLRRSPDKKVSKPLMEKRRRARINHSLAQLKALVIDPNAAEKSRQAKLEKADILELTVQHLHEIQRQQRAAVMLDARHPKRKFEIGYSECAREVELFLSNFVDPQRPGLDGDFPRRLKDHLLKRLNDFKSINSVADISNVESAVDSSGSESLSSPSTNSCPDDPPLAMDSDETDTSDHSSLKEMLSYYSVRNVAKENIGDVCNGKRVTAKCSEISDIDSKGEEVGLPHSCQSVSSTTGSRSGEYLQGQDLLDDHLQSKLLADQLENDLEEKFQCHLKDQIENRGLKTPSDDHHRLKDRWCTSPDVAPSGSSSDQTPATVLRRAPPRVVAEAKPKFPPERSITPPVMHASREQSRRIIERIPLVPRQLANGDWALVLPASLVPTKDEDSRPISAFRLVLPSHPGPSDPDCENAKCGQSSASSPLSSSVSDLSAEEYCSKFENDSMERMDHGSPDSTQSVWRPW